VQTRLLSCLVGGFLGVAVASPVGGSLGLSPAFAMIGCLLLGISLGYVVSILIDVFMAPTGEVPSPSAPPPRASSRPNRLK
jgi:hypothetical protein